MTRFMAVMEAHFSSGGNILTETLNIRQLFPKRFEAQMQQQNKADFTTSMTRLCMILSPTSVVSIQQTHLYIWMSMGLRFKFKPAIRWRQLAIPYTTTTAKQHCTMTFSSGAGTSVWLLPSTWSARGCMQRIKPVWSFYSV